MQLSWLQLHDLKQRADLAKNDRANGVMIDPDDLAELVEKYDEHGQFHAGLDEQVAELTRTNSDLETEAADARAEADAATEALEKIRDLALEQLELIQSGGAFRAK